MASMTVPRNLPPDASTSYLGTYGFGAWTVWLMNQASELVAETPTAMLRGQPAPMCPVPDCHHGMVRRPGAWKCYRHQKFVDGAVVLRSIVVVDKYEVAPAPDFDALAHVDDVLDMVYKDGGWKVVVCPQ